MDRVTKYLVLIGACIGLSGCMTIKKSGKAVTLNPASCVLTPDAYNRVYVNMDFQVPDGYFSKRSRLFITPQFMSGDTVVEEYFPVVVDAPVYSKKMHRKKVLHGYKDLYGDYAFRQNHVSRGFNVHFQDTLILPEEILLASTKSSINCFNLCDLESKISIYPCTL